MAILGNIRKTGNTFVVIVVAFLIIVFLSGELARVIPYFFSDKDQIGRLSGEKISYMDYHKSYEAICRYFSSQGKQRVTEDQIRDHAWRQLIERMLYIKEIRQAGIAVGTQELIDLVQGEHIDAELIEAFNDPETSAFDKKKLLAFLSNLSESEQKWWCEVEKAFALKRAKKKLHQLMMQSCFMTTSEEDHAAQNASLFCNVTYIYIPFTSVKDELVPLTNQQLRDYMAANKARYRSLLESRTIKYITFPILPNEKDNADFQKLLNSLVVQFSTTADPYTFAKQHTDGSLSDTRLVCTADTLPSDFTTIKRTLKVGMVVGPVITNSFYTVYKLVKEENGKYEIARIEKKIMVSDHTRSKYFSHVTNLTSSVKKLADFEKLANNEHFTIKKEIVAPSDISIGAYANAHNVVHWLYNEATVGKVSQVFDVGNAYLLAVMVDQVKIGDLVPLDSVFQEVYQKVLHQEKSKIILNKLKHIEAITLQDIAEQYGEGATIHSLERLRFLSNDVSHLKDAQVFLGKCFGLDLNVISAPIIDNTGIFMVCVKSKDRDATQEKHNEQMRKIERWMQPYYVSNAMEELAQVIDQRYKYRVS